MSPTALFRSDREGSGEELRPAALDALAPMAAVIGVRRQQRHDRARFGEHHLLDAGVDLAPARRLLESRGRAGAVAHVGDGDLHSVFVHFHVLMAEDLGAEDRKSTRLNSSHVKISYAVFCL